MPLSQNYESPDIKKYKQTENELSETVIDSESEDNRKQHIIDI